MHTLIAFLHGINVGGHGLLPMPALRACLEAIGATQVRTYIQSGNAVFHHPSADTTSLAGQLSSQIQLAQGFGPHSMVLTRSALARAMEANPFPEAEAHPNTLHLGFLAHPAHHARIDQLHAVRSPSERFVLTDAVFYLHAPEGIGRSRLAATAEKLLGVPKTDRNWRTVCKVMALADA